MMVLGLLVPGLILGAIAWGAVGVLRSRGREEFTLATAANFYAQVMIVAAVLAVLSGIAVLIKLGIAQIDPVYSYFVPPDQYSPGTYGGPPSIAQQQTQDVILAAMLVGVGLVVGVGHWFLSRFVRSMPGASPTWIVRGTLVGLTVLTGLAAIFGTLVGGYTMLSYFIVGQTQGMIFGDAVGAAVVFLPAWFVAMTVLLRQARHPAPKAPTSMIATPA